MSLQNSKHIKHKRCNVPHAKKLKSHPRISVHPFLRRTRWKTHCHAQKFEAHPFKISPTKNVAFLVCRVARCWWLLGWNTCLTNRLSKEREVHPLHHHPPEVCTEKNQRCGDSRVGPGKHRWVTVYLQIRASQHRCSTFFTAPESTNVVLRCNAFHVFFSQPLQAARFYLFGLRHACWFLVANGFLL